MPFTATKLSAAIGLVAAAVCAIIALDSVTVFSTDVEPILIGLITGLAGVFFPKQ